jgi:hypothetical protein
MPNLSDNFLYILSSIKNIKISPNVEESAFNQFYIRYFSSNENEYRFWLTQLEALGFVSISYETGLVSIDTPLFCHIVGNKNTVVLTGARTPSLIDIVRQVCEKQKLQYRQENLNDDLCPTKVLIQGDEESLNSLSEETHIPITKNPPSFNLISIKPVITDFVKISPVEVDSYNCEPSESIKRCIMNNLNCAHSWSLYPETATVFNSETLQYSVESRSNITRPTLEKYRMYYTSYNYVFVNEGKKMFFPSIEKRYGKYLILADRGKKLYYDTIAQTLYVPKYCPLPSRYSKALGMCSCLPLSNSKLDKRTVKGLGFVECEMPFIGYQGVPEVIVKILCKSLGIEYKSI